MNATRLTILFAVLAAGSTAPRAHAQIFATFQPSIERPTAGAPSTAPPGPEGQPPTPGKEGVPAAGAARRAKLQRFQFGFFGSKWSTANSIIRPEADITTVADPGFLMSGEIFLSPKWSIGGYWNHFHGKSQQIPEGSGQFEQVGTDTIDVAEGHLAYYLGKRFGGWSLQAGAGGSADRTVFDFNRQPERSFHARNISFWLNNAAKVGMIGKHQVDLFGGLGARTSELVGTGVRFHLQLLTGAAVHLNRYITGNCSVWTSDVDANPNTRVNGGFAASL